MKQIIILALMLNFNFGMSQSRYLKNQIKQQQFSNKIIGKKNNSELLTFDKKDVALNSYIGKCMIIDFWFTKCGPCFREFPFLENQKGRFQKDTSLLFVNICSESSEDDWRQVVAEKFITGINLFDANEVQRERRIIGTPRPSGLGTVHDQMYLTGYPGYAFFNSEGKIMGATTVPPSDSVLFAFYIEGLLENKTIEESLQIFKSEIKKTETSNKFNSFIQRRFHVNGDDRKRILEPYRKYF